MTRIAVMTSPDGWIKAAASNDAGACVEVRRRPDRIEVRDSKAGDSGPVLSLRPVVFRAWLGRAKAGQLDHLSRKLW